METKTVSLRVDKSLGHFINSITDGETMAIDFAGHSKSKAISLKRRIRGTMLVKFKVPRGQRVNIKTKQIMINGLEKGYQSIFLTYMAQAIRDNHNETEAISRFLKLYGVPSTTDNVKSFMNYWKMNKGNYTTSRH